MDIILDSSVWFEYFKRKDPYFKEVQMYLNILSIKIIEPVIGEILQGALNKKELSFIKENIEFVPKVEIKNLSEKAGVYSFENKLVSKGIGLIDSCLIVASMETNSLLWTLDKKIVNFMDTKYLYKIL
jgi:predicted nucleic acid-binding protein